MLGILSNLRKQIKNTTQVKIYKINFYLFRVELTGHGKTIGDNKKAA